MPRVLVIGSGLAGLLTAVRAADAGHRVVLATKGRLDEGSTGLAQGGIAAAVFPGDSAARHALDTLAAGTGHADARAVRVLCEEGPAAVRELIRHGVRFDGDESGLSRGLEAAHTRPRILHADGDATGRVVRDALLAALARRPVEVLEDALLAELAVDDGGDAGGRVVGATLLLGGHLVPIAADATVLATGGWGVLYGRTTNPAVSTGDGVAAAIRAGAAVADLEFTQFHPTALAVPGAPLVSEAVRGEGAVLLDAAGRRFLPEVDPRAELAPRDVVARAVHRVMAEQGGAPVRLDATALGAAFLARRFPGVDAICRAAGFDWAREPVPVTPAAHYAMGGVVVDLDGRTSLPGLLAVGEVARTGVHGANRLASNSLLEAAVFALRAVRALDADPVAGSAGPVGDSVGADVGVGVGVGAFGDPARHADSEASPHGASAGISEGGHTHTLREGGDAREGGHEGTAFDRGALQRLMWDEVGLVRDAEGLGRAAGILAALDAPQGATRTALEDRNLLELARRTTRAALARTASMGAHHRGDAPAPATHPAEAPGADSASADPASADPTSQEAA